VFVQLNDSISIDPNGSWDTAANGSSDDSGLKNYNSENGLVEDTGGVTPSPIEMPKPINDGGMWDDVLGQFVWPDDNSGDTTTTPGAWVDPGVTDDFNSGQTIVIPGSTTPVNGANVVTSGIWDILLPQVTTDLKNWFVQPDGKTTNTMYGSGVTIKSTPLPKPGANAVAVSTSSFPWLWLLIIAVVVGLFTWGTGKGRKRGK